MDADPRPPLDAVTWDILILTLPERAASLAGVVSILAPQLTDGVSLDVHVTDTSIGHGDARREVLEHSTAEYVSFVDDDDLVASNYVAEIKRALKSQPDMVGFLAKFTYDGVDMPPISISLQHGNWLDPVQGSVRDLFQWAPIRRELSLAGGWEGRGIPGDGEDQRWANRLRALGIVKTEVYIPKQLYIYRQVVGHRP
jgi:hypothetical protein